MDIQLKAGLRFIECVDCGKIIEATGNHHKRCIECKKVKSKEKWQRYYLKNKERLSKVKHNLYKEKNPIKLCKKCKKEIVIPWKRLCDDCLIKSKSNQRRLRLRFIILQRDNFTCQYCGRKAPDVILEIDHIYPKSRGGLNKQENYKTACKECNLGKGDIILDEFY